MNRLFLFLVILWSSSSIWAEEACNSSECRYTVQLDKTGAYVAFVTLPDGQKEGMWSLLINQSRQNPYYVNGFWAGMPIKENKEQSSWIGFSLDKSSSIQFTPHNWTNFNSPLTMQIDKGLGDSRTLMYGPVELISEQKKTISLSEPGFYIAMLQTQLNAPRTYSTLSLEGDRLYGGVVGGWLDSYTGKSYGAFAIDSPQQAEFLLYFGDTFGREGSGKPNLEVFYQHSDGKQEFYWKAPGVKYTPKASTTNLPIPDNASWAETVEFLHEGDNPLQTSYVDENGNTVPLNIVPNSAAIIVGKVVDSYGNPLPDVKISVENCAECGQTLTAGEGSFVAKGEFLLAVQGPGKWNLKYEKEGYIALEKFVQVPCEKSITRANIRALVKIEEGEGLRPQAAGSSASGGVVSDVAGKRQAKLFFPPGTQATMVLPNCSEQKLDELNVSVTEYTQGDPGVEGESTGMPFELPGGTGYTYAVEFSVEEAEKANAREVKFNQPVLVYVDNFLGFPVGAPVPSGYYDYNLENWVPSDNGYVVNIIGNDGRGQPELDTGGTNITFSNEEKQQIVTWYSNEGWFKNRQGKEFWRIPVTHFSPFDFNYPRVPSPDAEDPDVPEATDNDKNEEDPCEQEGCIIEAQNQVLGEQLPVVGTPFTLNYRSNRVPGRKAAYSLDIPLRKDSLPESLKRIRLEINIAGRRTIEEIFCNEQNPNVEKCENPAPSIYYFAWDGKDDLGRPLPGKHQANIKIDYLYDAYYQLPANVAKSFGLDGQGNFNSETGTIRIPARQEIAKSKSYRRELGGIDAKSLIGLGGWTLDFHHTYDSINNVLYEGRGSQRSVMAIPKPEKPQQSQVFEPEPEPQPEPPQPQVIDLTDNMRVSFCSQTCDTLNYCVADCGKVLVGAARIESDALQWIGSEPVSSFKAESDKSFFGFTGLSNHISETTPTNKWILEQTQSAYIYEPLAFNDSPSLNSFFAPEWVGSVEAKTLYTTGKAYSSDIPEGGKYGTGYKMVIVRGEGKQDDRISPAITLDINVNDSSASVDASAQCLAVGNETIFTVIPRLDRSSPLLQEVAPVEHIIVDLEVEAKNTPQCASFKDEVLTANNFAVNDYLHHLNGVGQSANSGCEPRRYSFLVSMDKPFQFKASKQFATQDENNPKGYVQYTFSVRGHKNSSNPAEWQGSYKKFHLTSTDNTRGRFSSVRSGGASCPIIDNALIFTGKIASRDGGLLYEFEGGLHKRTLDSLTGQIIYTFDYDERGFLIRVTDIDNDVTVIERDNEGNPVAIVSPYGQRTRLTLNKNGYLTSVTNAANEVHQLEYTNSGLLVRYTDPRGYAETYEYDELGLFVRNLDGIGGGYTVTSEQSADGSYSVSMKTRGGRESIYTVAGNIRTNVTPDGRITRVEQLPPEKGKELTDITSIHNPDDTYVWIEEAPDERLAGLYGSPSTKVTAITTPSGLKAEIVTETATDPLPISDGYDLLNLKRLTQKIKVNGRESWSAFNKDDNTITAVSAAGRKNVSFLDDKGRIVKEQVAGFADTTYSYDERGRLVMVATGEGADSRTATLSYDAQGNIEKVTDTLGRSVSFAYDPVGRITSQQLTDGRQIFYRYDMNGNVTSITPPGQPTHHFSYNGENLQSEYVPPSTGLKTPQTQYIYNLDQQLTKITRPDGQDIDFAYDVTKGRLNALHTPLGSYSYSYADKSGQLTGVTAPDGNNLRYEYDGFLPLSVTWEGAVQGNLSVSYDNDFRVTSTRINGEHAVNYEYDADSLLVKAGDLWLVRDPENGLLKGTQLGGKEGIITQRAYNPFGELANDSASHRGNVLYSNQYARDKLGRITQKVEVIEGVSTTYAYNYDQTGRLITVTQNGVITEQYSYDANGNRLTANTVTHGSMSGNYDEQDRLLQYGDNAYNYTANGELLSKTTHGATTRYNYDVLGSLRSVQLPDGKQIEYVIDANGRRVGKKVDGVLTHAWLYQGSLNPIAELDGNGNVVTRFVYGAKANVPDYLIKEGNTYRIVSDHLGSPRLVIDLNTGTVVQRMEYDAFGNVIFDTNPGFQPFGFAGGIYDADTGLVRFGARDYDAEIGRWAAKEPIGFISGSSNLYAYSFSDPVNWIDINGLYALPAAPFVLGVAEIGTTALAALAGVSVGTIATVVAVGVGVYFLTEWAIYGEESNIGKLLDKYNRRHPQNSYDLENNYCPISPAYAARRVEPIPGGPNNPPGEYPGRGQGGQSSGGSSGKGGGKKPPSTPPRNLGQGGEDAFIPGGGDPPPPLNPFQ